MSYRTDKLVIDGHTDTHTHIHTQATTIPEGQNWPRVKMIRLPQNKKKTYRLDTRPQMWPSALTLAMTLTLIFKGQICNLLYENKHIDWALGFKCDHQIWPWPWAWPWIFKVKYGICYISTKKGQIATKRKANISNELQASNVTNGFDLGKDFDLWIFKVKCDLDIWPYHWCWPRIFMVEFGNSCIS